MSAPPGPVALRLRSVDLDRASLLYDRAFGGVPLAHPAGGRRWWLAPGLVIDAVAGEEPGPDAIVLVADALDRIVDLLRERGIEHTTGDDHVTVTDARVASGHLELVEADHELARVAVDRTGAGTGGDVPVDGFDHLCLAVADLPLAVELASAAGGRAVIGGDSALGARIVQLRFPHLKLELMQPLGPGPLATFVDRRAGRAGIHHITLLVDDVPTAVAALEGVSVPTVGTDTSSQPSWQETYVRPAAADGLLIQLARTTNHHHTPLTDGQLRDVLAGHYIAHDHAMRRREEVDT